MSRSDDCYAMGDEDWAAMGVRNLDECGFDDTELLVLDLLRHFCMAYADPESHAWLGALRQAERHLGSKGPLLAHSVSEYLNALRSERMRPFNFVDPYCERCAQKIFPTEFSLMMALRGARLHDAELLHTCVLQVVERGQGHSTTLAAHALGASLTGLEKSLEPERASGRAPNGTFLH